MPYIKLSRRKKLPTFFFHQLPDKPKPGDVNYLICMMAREYVATHGESYQAWNDVAGAIGLSLQELYRRYVGDYEDDAIKRNGDIP